MPRFAQAGNAQKNSLTLPIRYAMMEQKERDVMPQVTNFAEQTATPAQEMPTLKPWQRQEGESALWFNRFMRYRELGPKRSLLAAVEQERGQITALKSTRHAPSVSKKSPSVDKKRQTVTKSRHLAEVPPPKTQVSGSWKQASIKWSWVERARAYDAYELDRVYAHYTELFVASDKLYTLPLDRISALQSLLKIMQDTYQANHNQMTIEQECACMARMQSILRDIRDEMKLAETEFVQVATRKRLEHWQKNGEKVFAPPSGKPHK